MPAPVYRYPWVPPKSGVAFLTDFLKGKRAVPIHRHIIGHKSVTGRHFCALRYCVMTVGLDDETICPHIREQEALESTQTDLETYNSAPMGLSLPHLPSSKGFLRRPTLRMEF